MVFEWQYPIWFWNYRGERAGDSTPAVNRKFWSKSTYPNMPPALEEGAWHRLALAAARRRKIRVAAARQAGDTGAIAQSRPVFADTKLYRESAMHKSCAPAILYFGTPVVLTNLWNENGSGKLTPISMPATR